LKINLQTRVYIVREDGTATSLHISDRNLASILQCYTKIAKKDKRVKRMSIEIKPRAGTVLMDENLASCFGCA
jgi:hypothetical protein